jgi:hypothetical protein
MTEKKLDEAVSLNVSSTDGELNSSTTINAASTMDLVTLLKNAGIKSAMFNGPATLTASENIDDLNSMSTTINAPNLRAIMNMLEPEFQAVGDMEAQVADMGAEMDDDHIVDPAPVEEPVTEPEMVPAEEPCVDCAADVDMGMDLEGPVEEQALNENAEDFVYEFMEEKLVGSQGCEEEENGYGETARIAWTTVTPEEFAQFGEDGAGEEAHDRCMALGGDTTGFEDHMAQFMPNDYDVEGGMDLTKPALYFVAWISEEMEESAEYDYRTHEVGPEEFAGKASKEIVQPATKSVPARSGDNPLAEGPFDDKRGQFPDTEQGAIEFMKFMSSHNMDGATARPDPVVDGVWLVSHKNGKSIVYLNDMDFEDIDETIKPKSFREYVEEANTKNAPVAPKAEKKVTMESLMSEFKNK